MRARTRGLAALMDVARLVGPPQAWHLGFLLGPRINAGGRIGDAALGARLLLTAGSGRGRANRRRARPPERRAPRHRGRHRRSRPGRGRSRAGPERGGRGHRGRGRGLEPGHRRPRRLAAEGKIQPPRPSPSRYRAKPGRAPAGRSPASISARRCAQAVEAGILAKGGGHAMAAGVTIARDRLGEFRAFLEERLAAKVAVARAEPRAADRFGALGRRRDPRSGRGRRLRRSRSAPARRNRSSCCRATGSFPHGCRSARIICAFPRRPETTVRGWRPWRSASRDTDLGAALARADAAARRISP